MKNMKKNKKGFTLIELLAVIVILGVIMAIAIPSMTGYIANSKKDAMISSAQQMISAAKDLITSDNAYPAPGTATIIKVKDIQLEKGGNSPYDNQPFTETASYVLVHNTASSEAAATSSDYVYYISLRDSSGNCLPLTSESYLASAKTKTRRNLVKGGATSFDNGSGNPCSQVQAAAATGNKTYTVFKTSTSSPITPSSTNIYAN